jgi:hypothetical protein
MFSALSVHTFWHFGLHGSTPLDRKIHDLTGLCYAAPGEALRALDIAFFEGIYAANASRIFSAAEMEEKFGMPTAHEQSAAWSDGM